MTPTNNLKHNKIIGKPFKIGFEVAQNDFPNELNWYDARKACDSLGNGWRLPTIQELNILFENKDEIGKFKGTFYWSSTEASYMNNDYDGAYGKILYKGGEGVGKKTQLNHVRAIRSFQ
jgi:formylglycine-generating enzyme required for sulfatase activity